MAARFMLDTDTCIYIRNRRPEPVFVRFGLLGPGEAVISVVTYGELLLGAEKGQNQARDLSILQAFADTIQPQGLPASAASHYAIIRAGLERAGTPIGANDLWIAAHARAAGLTLVTNNEREFRRVPGLSIENWAAEAA